jgi:multiple sugar transport system permease protein
VITSRPLRVFTSVALALIGLVVVGLPLLYMLVIATGGPGQSLSSLWPSEWNLVRNIRFLFEEGNFGRFMLNSLIMAGGIAVLDVFLAGLAGYALAKLPFPGRRVVFGAVVATLALSPIVVIIPVYVLMRDVGWLNTYQGLIVPYMVSAFGVFLVRQFAAEIPDELLNAARIDGAGELRICLRVAFPLLRPALLTLFLLVFAAQWDNLLWPLVAGDSPDRWTVAVGLATYTDQQFRIGYPLLMGGALVAILPPLVIFAFLQKYYVRGLTLGSLKG